jgi:hypothetical protein
MYQKTEDTNMITAEKWFEVQIIEIERMREANHVREERLAARPSSAKTPERVNAHSPSTG